MGNHMNTLEQIKRETRDDARLYACIRDLYDQGVSLSDLKALIPDIRRTREQLQLKRMLQNNNEVVAFDLNADSVKEADAYSIWSLWCPTQPERACRRDHRK